MPDGADVLCFGGPWNEKVVRWVGQPTLLAPIPERVSYSLAEMAEPMAPMFKTARYDIEKVGLELDGRRYVWYVAINQGFPRHRILDQMDAILALCRFPWVAWLMPDRPTVANVGHALGDDCDICDGRGFDYLGRRCRRWAG